MKLWSTAPEQGKTTVHFALELKRDLKKFVTLAPHEQATQKIYFINSFLDKLHSQDDIMSTHRAHWRVLVANILIAFTGIGLFALGIHYLRTKELFFSETNREKYIANIEQNNDLRLSMQVG